MTATIEEPRNDPEKDGVGTQEPEDQTTQPVSPEAEPAPVQPEAEPEGDTHVESNG